MLTSDTIEQWDKAYNNTPKILTNNPKKYHILNSIYEQPTYYVGHYTRTIEGNLKWKCSSPTEQNIH